MHLKTTGLAEKNRAPENSYGKFERLFKHFGYRNYWFLNHQ